MKIYLVVHSLLNTGHFLRSAHLYRRTERSKGNAIVSRVRHLVGKCENCIEGNKAAITELNVSMNKESAALVC